MVTMPGPSDDAMVAGWGYGCRVRAVEVGSGASGVVHMDPVTYIRTSWIRTSWIRYGSVPIYWYSGYARIIRQEEEPVVDRIQAGWEGWIQANINQSRICLGTTHLVLSIGISIDPYFNQVICPPRTHHRRL